MERQELRTRSRTVIGKQVRQMRAKEWVPAVVYGPDQAARSIEASERVLGQVLRSAGSTSLVDLFVDEEPAATAVLVREVQRNPLNGRLVHVDFYQVRLTEKVKTTPPIHFHGEPALVKAGQAVLLHSMTQVAVECLPTDLIQGIDVDVSGLVNVGDAIFVRDLQVPAGITVLDDPSEVVASLVPVRMTIKEEVEEEAAAEAPEAEAAEEKE
ncbi:MAG TPA: 50S ribosomal protein L25 [Anaerolineae bacterium]|nr:50S ribosomal protein L25 [Anaerolineae bacterium]